MTRARSWLPLAAALLALDVSVTFVNLWPTPAISWHGRLSIELAALVVVLAIAGRRGEVSRAVVNILAAVWTLLVLGRYAEVTAQGLYGRDVNLYWDLRFIPDVAAMVARVAKAWLVIVVVAAAAAALALLFAIVRLAIARLAAAVSDRAARRRLVSGAALLTIFFVAERAGVWVAARDIWNTPEPLFPTPVTVTYARQIRVVAQALAGAPALPQSPPMDSDLSRVAGADVFLIFIESYGAISFDHPEISRRLAPARNDFAAAVAETHRSVVSAFVESPTFGGGSWLAHLSLLSGIEVRDPETNATLMAARRDTMARAFGRHGFRTIGLMPGMRQSWPEGSFYGFDAIYSAAKLDYHGPEFGWFAIPDQYSLARLDAAEIAAQPRRPAFVFFPTISTHFPFLPAPPYQPDWPRMLASNRPYDGPSIVRAYDRQPDWITFIPGYAVALTYDFATIGGYLRLRADRDGVMILLGDHQPPALVTGEGASHDVPVHIVASRRAILDRLESHGFRRGMTPQAPAIGHMHALLPILLDAFGDRPPAASRPTP